MKDGDKLYVVVKNDLEPGQQAAQLCHAVSEFFVQYPQQAQEWHKQSNYICLLQANSENYLGFLLFQARQKNIPCVQFREPDYGNALTAIAIHPDGKGLVKHLSLAFSPP